jgi:hypothetical protein
VAEHRYSFDPLERLLLVRLRDREDREDMPPRRLGSMSIARELDEDRTTILRARERGLTREAAERLAEKAGYIPYELWPEILDHDIATIERVCASPDCDVRFIPDDPRQKKCSRRCVLRDAGARYKDRHRDVVLERARASAARYYAENGDYVRARRRRAYHEARGEAA